MKELEEKLKKMLEEKGKPSDSLIFLPITSHQIHNMRIYGRNDLDAGEITGEKSTLILLATVQSKGKCAQNPGFSNSKTRVKLLIISIL